VLDRKTETFAYNFTQITHYY